MQPIPNEAWCQPNIQSLALTLSLLSTHLSLYCEDNSQFGASESDRFQTGVRVYSLFMQIVLHGWRGNYRHVTLGTSVTRWLDYISLFGFLRYIKFAQNVYGICQQFAYSCSLLLKVTFVICSDNESHVSVDSEVTLLSKFWCVTAVSNSCKVN